MSREQIVTRLVESYGYNRFFAERLVEDLGGDALLAAESAESLSKKAIRVNTLKTTHEQLAHRLASKGFILKRIPWLTHGYWVEQEPNTYKLGATHEYLFGHYFLQSPPSMYTVEVLDPQPGEIVLDLAAGAGGKTTYISQLMKNSGIVVAVEPKRSKVAALRSNVSRMGCANTVVLQMDGRSTPSLGLVFDRVLLDAPCTSSGVVAKHPKLKQRISTKDVAEQQTLQLALLDAAYKVLKPGGVLVYSTCSYFREEGEEVIGRLIHRGASVTPINPPGETQSKEWVRFYPHIHGTEAFFVCKITKT
ncbi:MAG: RsmB/NOP family class I SAM-dependent RNA methyltransferase [Thermoprotei archaeon]